MGHVVFGRAIALCYVISPAAFSGADNKNGTGEITTRNKRRFTSPSHNAPAALPVTANRAGFLYFFLFAAVPFITLFSPAIPAAAVFSPASTTPAMARRRPPSTRRVPIYNRRWQSRAVGGWGGAKRFTPILKGPPPFGTI